MIPGTAFVLLAAPAFASHEDFGFGARAAGMGDAACSSGDEPGGALFNPALLGTVTAPEVQGGLRRAFQTPAGAADHDQMEGAAAAPIRAFPWRGALGIHDRDTGIKDVSRDRNLGVTYATHGWRETDDGVVDWGISLNGLSRAGRMLAGTVTKAGVDLGAIFRIHERYNLAASLINLNGPRTDIGGVPDRAPVTLRVGLAQVARGFTMALEGIKREPSAGRRSTQSVALGAERWTFTGRLGAVALRSGVTLGDQARTWAIGAGWRALGAEVDYAALAPLSSGRRWGNAVSLVFRFGAWDTDKEFEKLLGSEVRYRQDLARALDTAEVKQWKLAEELRRLKAELDDLQAELHTRTASEAQAQEKYRAARDNIRDLEDREREAQRQLAELEKSRKAVAEKAAEPTKEERFREDWRTYEKLKLQGAPDVMLLERVKQVLKQYRESGVDLSEASQELRRLLRGAESREAPAGP